MTKEERIKQCRYYRGEKECPFTSNSLRWYWDMERVYVKVGEGFTGETEIYRNINGKEFKGIPFTLLMVMFTSWAKEVYDIRGSIDKFYAVVNSYLELVSEHLSPKKIPGS